MIMFSKILFPVDFSDRGEEAAHAVRAMAVQFQSEVTALHVVEVASANSEYESLIARAGEKMDQLVTRELRDCVVVPYFERGDPAQVILSYVRNGHFDLVMMPTHGYGPFRRFLLGSVTAKVLHDAICPVWTGPHMERAPDYTTVHFRNIVCALDLGSHSRQVLRWAAGFAREFGARLSIVHAIPSSSTRLGAFYFDPDWRTQLTRTAMERIGFLRQEMEIEASVAIEAGEPPVVVATAAETMRADLLV